MACQRLAIIWRVCWMGLDKGEAMKIIILPGLDGTGLMLERFVHLLSKHHNIAVIPYPLDIIYSYD